MISSLQATKYYFDELFMSSWTSTPVHYAGQEFNAKEVPQWVNPFYAPKYGDKKGLSNTLSSNYGNLYVACWAETDVEVMAIADDVVAFLNNIVNKEYRVKKYEISDHGWQESNQVYIMLTFSLEVLDGACAAERLGCSTPYPCDTVWEC